MVQMTEESQTRGVLSLSIRFEAPTAGEKGTGTLHAKIQQGRNLPIKEPYIKLYLSSDDKDLQTTKQKTKPVKSDSPSFDENFVFYLPPKTPLDDNNRLQITLWNHAGKLGSNDCAGGFSFSMAELSKHTDTDPLTGWFEFLDESKGRHTNVSLDESEIGTATLKRSGSQKSLNSVEKTKTRSLAGSIKKKILRKDKSKGSKSDTASHDTAPHKGDDDDDDDEDAAQVASRLGVKVQAGKKETDVSSTHEVFIAFTQINSILSRCF
jgi:hypothetical protein